MSKTEETWKERVARLASEWRDRRGVQCGPRVVAQDLAVVVVAAGP